MFRCTVFLISCADVILARADRIQKSLKSKTKDSDTADVVLVSILCERVSVRCRL